MPIDYSKLDIGLMEAYEDFLDERASDIAERCVHVALRYEGDIAEIEALGFTPVWMGETGEATGSVDLVRLEAITSHPGVLKLTAGEEFEPMLDKSIPDVEANKVWTFSAGSFTGEAGAGVVIGIIDTGIDFRHLHFRKRTGAKPTRILRIWDQGLKKKAWEKQPAVADLATGTPGTYGVLYDDADINKTLNKVGDPAKHVRHRDCNGHGTHVASTAAGNGESKNKYIGVAPEADIVVVKYLDLENKAMVGATEVKGDQRFKDAISFVLAAAGAKPVVINCSFGGMIGPHDGFTDSEDWLTDKFSGTSKKVVVMAAGNSAGDQQHASIDLPAAGTAEFQFDLYDTRGAKRLKFEGCKNKPGTKAVYLDLLYAPAAPLDKVEIDLPRGGGTVTSPVLGSSSDGKLLKRDWKIWHVRDDQVLRGGRGTVERRRVLFRIKPYRNRHVVDKYTMRVKSTGAFKAHLWCQQHRGHGFKIAATSPTPSVDTHLIGASAGADNVITVAAHNAEDATLPVTGFSSRGPLAHYSGPAQPAKPNIAAPGWKVDAAKGVHAKPWQPVKTVSKSGTSMAAPHVAGAAALLLAKKSTLTTKQVIDTLKGRARTVPPPVANEVGAGRLDCEEAYKNVP